MTERERLDVDVLIVGAGPAGLATAIRLKQLSPETDVAVIEKGAEIGAHILSGAVIDPSGLDALLPGWRDTDHPLKTPVTADKFYLTTATGAFAVPAFMLPPLMSNHGNFIASLGNVCRWLASQAEALGVQIFPGFPGADLVLENGTVAGVVTGDAGRNADGGEGSSFAPGVELHAKYTVLAEGARGSLTKQAIAQFGLDRDREPQKYGIGLKELWQVDPSQHQPGLVAHFMGWPLDDKTGGGGFMYHLEGGQVAIGLVLHLNYKNPYLSPFGEFQRLKTHPLVRKTLTGGKRLSYGARALSEGGWQSVPNLAFPGGVLVGDAAGFMNLPRIKGSHNAVHSGILAADAIAAALRASRSLDTLTTYDASWQPSPIGRDLSPVRNVKPLWSRFGTLLGVFLGGFDMWFQTLFRVSPFGTLKHGKPDWAALEPASQHTPIDYPKPDGVLTFDRTSSVYVSNTNHREGQPRHLQVRDLELQKRSEHDIFAGPSSRYCPAAVYEWTEGPDGLRFVINAQNCVHCKTCDIKDPNQNITWVPPEGGGGPNYTTM